MEQTHQPSWLKKYGIHAAFFVIVVFSVLYMYKDANLKGVITAKNELASMHYYYFSEQKIALLNYSQFPLWSPTVYGGTPLLALPQSNVLHLTGFIPTLFFDNLELGMNMIAIVQSILAAMFMYLLMLIGFRISPFFAFLASMVYIFNQYFLGTTPSWIDRNNILMFVPLAFLLWMLAIRKKNFLPFAIGSGIVLALQFLGGGLDYFMLWMIVPATYFLFEGIIAALQGQYGKILKLGIIGAVMGTVFIGLIMVKLLPTAEFKPYSSKSTGFDYERSKGNTLEWKALLTLPFNDSGIEDSKGGTRIGWTASILFLGSLLTLRKKRTIYFFMLLIISLLLAVGTGLYYPLWRFVPGFTAFHNLLRVLFVSEFAIAVLIGFGAEALYGRFGKTKLAKYWKIAALMVVALLIFELVIAPFAKIPNRHPSNFYLPLGVEGTARSNELMSYISKQPGLFRVHNLRNNEIAGWTPMYIAVNRLQELMGVASVWITEHLNVYLSIAHTKPAKFWGMLNTKYIYSEDMLNESDIPGRYKEGLRLIKTFNQCEQCYENPSQDRGVDGPYLYENEYFLPRAYMVNNSFFIIADDSVGGAGQQLMYGIMTNDGFNSKNSAAVMRHQKKPLTKPFLTQFSDIIIQQENVDGNLINDREIKPRVIISQEMFLERLNDTQNTQDSYKEMPITFYSPNKMIIKLEGERGIMVLAEKFFLFPGWTAKIRGIEKELLRANGINTALFLDGEAGDLIVEYKPKSFIVGATISIIAFALAAGYYLFILARYLKNKKANKTVEQSQN
ncbi:hypothetical protein HYV84_06530 [Candidatus Woesearchaeota archaeon]|nr:hypothetical protein [Candidatus Woesearchaeota archaeon]